MISNRFVLFSDDRCPAIPKVAHSKVDTNVALFGTNVTYWCDTGYVFPDRSVTTTIQCDGQTKAWNKQIADCQGTH